MLNFFWSLVIYTHFVSHVVYVMHDFVKYSITSVCLPSLVTPLLQ